MHQKAINIAATYEFKVKFLAAHPNDQSQ